MYKNLPIRLDLNENPTLVPHSVRDAILNSLTESNRYPMELEKQTLEKLSTYFNVSPSNILITNGIDECIDQLIGIFKSMRFATVSPGFNGYGGRLEVHKQPSVKLFRKSPRRWIDDSELSKLGQNDFFILANPDNPTGSYLEEVRLKELRSRVGRILIDHTYIDYLENRKGDSLTDDGCFYFYSFSKYFSLASMRLGILIGEKSAIQKMAERQWFCNINTPALAAINAVLDEKDWLLKSRDRILSDKKDLREKLINLGFDVLGTKTNFILLDARNHKNMVDYLAQRSIKVKDTSEFGLDGYIRISIGKRSENEFLVRELNDYVKSNSIAFVS